MTHRILTLADCRSMDAGDSLAKLRNQFDLPANTIYLDGNSLGAMPKASLKRAQAVISEEWGSGLIRSWNTAGWFDLPRTLGNKLARLVGGRDNEVVVTDTTSINLFKVLAAALREQKLARLVKAQRARRHLEGVAHLANGHEIAVHSRCLPSSTRLRWG